MDLLIGHDETVARWLGDRLGVTFVAPFAAIGVIDGEGRLCAGWLVNGYNGSNGDLTVYAPGLMTRRTIRACYTHLFIDLQLTRATSRVRRDNAVQRKNLPRIGFSLECVARRYYGPRKRDDAFVFVLFSGDAARWLK